MGCKVDGDEIGKTRRVQRFDAFLNAHMWHFSVADGLWAMAFPG